MSLPTSWDTSTSTEKSQADIIGVLNRFGCEEFGFRNYPDGAVAVTFRHDGIPIRIKVDPNRLVARVMKIKPHTARTRKTRADYEESIREQAVRVTWRNLHDLLKVMLNQAESDMIDFRTLMLPFILIGDTVVADSILGNLDDLLSGQLALPPAPDDPYSVLGVKQDATMKEIEDRHAMLVKRHHPDKPKGSTALMAKVNVAFEAIKKEKENPDA